MSNPDAESRIGHLSIRDLSKSYGQTKALSDVNIEVQAGEFLALLGPSGCGKTTLLRSIAGLVEIDHGEVTIDGKRLNETPPWKRDISVVFQSYALFPHMNVRDNLAFGLRMKGVRKSKIDTRINDTLKLVRMEDFKERYPAQLSGGQQQRVALARAIVVQPRILLLDEPLAALDAKLRASVQREIRQLQSKLKITTILVTHDQSEAMSMADRIAVMDNGHVVQIADPTTLYRHPKTAFAAEFVGDINRLSGKMDYSGQCVRLADGLAVSIEAGRPEGPGDGDAALLMVRPEAVRISRTPVEGFCLTGVINDVVLIGDRVNIYATCVDTTVKVVKLTGSSDAEIFLPGEKVFLSWDQADSLVFAA